MTATKLLQTIRSEIERRKDDAGIGLCAYDAGYENAICELSDSLLSFLDILETGQKPAEWSEEDGMEAINVFRPLAGTSIESATKQAVNKFTNSGKKFLLAFNGVFILIDNTKSVQDIVNEYNRSLGRKKKEQGQSEGEPNDFEITLNDCMLAAQQYPPGKIGWDDVKMWAEELSNYCPQPNQKWSEFDLHCLERAIWYVENPAPNVVKDTNLGLWLQSLKNRGNFLKSNTNSPSWSEEEDEKTINDACCWIAEYAGYLMDKNYGKASMLMSLTEKLKSLRPPQYCENCKLKRSVENWKPSEEQIGALNYAYCELFKREDVGHNILGPLQNLIDTLSKL